MGKRKVSPQDNVMEYVWDHVNLGGGIFATIWFTPPPGTFEEWGATMVPTPGSFRVKSCVNEDGSEVFPEGTGFDTLPGVYRYMANEMEKSM